jgi:hypothetical protein
MMSSTKAQEQRGKKQDTDTLLNCSNANCCRSEHVCAMIRRMCCFWVVTSIELTSKGHGTDEQEVLKTHAGDAWLEVCNWFDHASILLAPSAA